MSNSDYVTRAVGQAFCPKAALASSVGALDTTLLITGLQTTGPNDRWVGMAAMVGAEIVEITEINSGNVHVKRGCADTVPSPHASGIDIWFFESAVGTDRREYGDGETLALKVLPKTNSNVTPVNYSPPQDITFSHRFIRPYPPADVKVDGVSLFTATAPRVTASAGFTLGWATRNRVIQADQLLGHTEAGITPEAGQVTRMRLVRASDDVVVASRTSATTSLSYDRTMSIADFSLSGLSDTGDFAAYALIDSTRDGYESWQHYRLDFAIDTSGIVPMNFLLLESGDKLLLEGGGKLVLEN